MGSARAQPATAEQAAQIVVMGEGRISSVPDMATLTLGVQHEAPTASAAMEGMSGAARAVLDTLAEAGIAPTDMQTSGLSLWPRYSRSETRGDETPRIVGYAAETTVTVRVTDLAMLSGLLDAVVEGGANLFRSLSFGLTDATPLRDEAQKRAVADARRQAEILAAAAGVELGAVQRIETTFGSVPRPEMMRSAAVMDEGSVPVAEGEVSVSAQVRLVYGIGG